MLAPGWAADLHARYEIPRVASAGVDALGSGVFQSAIAALLPRLSQEQSASCPAS